jgi:hypothetical protein
MNKFIAIPDSASTNLGPEHHHVIYPVFLNISAHGARVEINAERAFPRQSDTT